MSHLTGQKINPWHPNAPFPDNYYFTYLSTIFQTLTTTSISVADNGFSSETFGLKMALTNFRGYCSLGIIKHILHGCAEEMKNPAYCTLVKLAIKHCLAVCVCDPYTTDVSNHVEAAE